MCLQNPADRRTTDFHIVGNLIRRLLRGSSHMADHPLLISRAQNMLIPGVPGDPSGALPVNIFDDTLDGGCWDLFISGELSDRRSGCIFTIQLALLAGAAHDVFPRTLSRHPDYL